ncbi:MAG: adenosine kinase [Bacteroidales bacterium]|nr:adenosine kinase [Bacteroidales bacterium]
MKKNPDSILGMGNALMDILVRIDNEELLRRLDLPKGSMTLVDQEKASQILNRIQSLPKSYAPGGSAANTIRGLAALDTPATYIGSTGKDDLGEMFKKSMSDEHVTTLLQYSDKPTGHAITFITPDSERTFATYLGAATELSAEHLDRSMFTGHRVFHIEGYLILNRDLVIKAFQLAKQARLEISYDMASYNVVEENKTFIRELLTEYVDIVFANEEEARAFTGKEPADALEELAATCKVAVVKTGVNGSLVAMEEETYMVKAIEAESLDTTGAGDLYAAGFLFGYVNNMLPEQCGKAGSLLGGKVIETIGTRMPAETWQEIREQIHQIIED